MYKITTDNQLWNNLTDSADFIANREANRIRLELEGKEMSRDQAIYILQKIVKSRPGFGSRGGQDEGALQTASHTFNNLRKFNIIEEV